MIHKAGIERFPVSEWIVKLQDLYLEVMTIHNTKVLSREDDKHASSSEKAWRPRSRWIRSGIFELNGSSASLSNRTSSFLTASSRTRFGSVVSLNSLRSSRVNLGLSQSNLTDNINSSTNQTFVVSNAAISKGYSLVKPRFTIGDDQESISSMALEENIQNRGFNGQSDTFTDHVNINLNLPHLDSTKGFDDIVQDEPFKQFTDEDGTLGEVFSIQLKKLNAKTSVGRLCIDTVIKKAEKSYYSIACQERLESTIKRTSSSIMLLFQTFCQHRLGNWSVYCILLGLGQLLSATSFQLVLLTGGWTSTDFDFTIIGIVFILGTITWWFIYRHTPSVIVVTIPFVFYGISLLLVGLPFSGTSLVIAKRMAVWIYAFASGSGSLFFALNFGEEAGVDMASWIFRAGAFEGLRQIWTVGLWYFLQTLPAISSEEVMQIGPSFLVSILTFLGCAILITIGIVLFIGLPSCYHHAPPSIPSFIRSFAGRRLALWFLISEFIKSYWLSGPYGRNWQFLWRQPIPSYFIFLLVLAFMGVWILLMFMFKRQSRIHAWILPVFAAGLLSPRWAQMSWSTSNIGDGLTWGGDLGDYFSLSLWLWLGALDAVQSVGLSMMLLQVT